MIVTKEVEVKLNQFNSHHYKRIGYDIEGKDFLVVDIKDVGKGTMTKVDVECDICGNLKQIGYRKYFKNISKYGKYSCSNKCAMFKNILTNNSRYGEPHQCKLKSVQDKILSTKVKIGLISIDFYEYSGYRRIVDNLTNRLKKDLIKNWNGFDYYDNEYIKDNFNLNSNDVNFPTIDHKISVLHGYNKGIDPINIASIDNLCITKRSNNSSKSSLTEDEFKIKKSQN